MALFLNSVHFWLRIATAGILFQLVLSQRTCLVENFGAVGDGTTVDTTAIQAALHNCSDGGIVVFRANRTYLSGTLFATGEVHLHIPEGCTLLASTEKADYPAEPADWYLLNMKNCSGCEITGGGVLDGQGRSWVVGRNVDRKIVQPWIDPACPKPIECRPRLLGVISSQNVRISSIHLVDPIMWCLHILESKQILIEDVQITGDMLIPNNDGIDIDGSSDVLIRNCKIKTADDALCIKTSTGRLPTHNVTAHNCTLTSKSSAIKIGSETRHNIYNLLFENIQVWESHRGLGIQLRDQGNVSDITFNNIYVDTRHYNQTWWGASEPIYVTAQLREANQTVIGRIDDVRFTNITANSEGGVVIAGCQQSRIGLVAMTDIRILLLKKSVYPGGYRDFRPGPLSYFNATVPVVYMEHAERVVLARATILLTPNPRPEWHNVFDAANHTVASISMDAIEVVDSRAGGGWEDAGVPVLQTHSKPGDVQDL